MGIADRHIGDRGVFTGFGRQLAKKMRAARRAAPVQSHEAGNRAEYTGMWEMGKKDLSGSGSGSSQKTASIDKPFSTGISSAHHPG